MIVGFRIQYISRREATTNMKHYSNQTFRITKTLTAYAWTENTSYGFRHLIELEGHYRTISTAKACYYNRTWEVYQYESVLKSLLEKSKNQLTKYEYKTFKSKIKNQFRKEDPQLKNLKTISMIASLGDIFANNQKESNDWKTRMLKAGLENKGLIMPEDWDTLSESEKEARLNGAIKQLA